MAESEWVSQGECRANSGDLTVKEAYDLDAKNKAVDEMICLKYKWEWKNVCS